MHRKDAFAVDAVIGMVKSTNHRFRVVTIFRRADAALVSRTGSGGDKIKQRTSKSLAQPTLEAT